MWPSHALVLGYCWAAIIRDREALMNLRTMAGMIALCALALSACSTETVKRSTYEALQQKGCIDRSGSPHCEPQHKDYDAYQKARDAALKPKPE